MSGGILPQGVQPLRKQVNEYRKSIEEVVGENIGNKITMD